MLPPSRGNVAPLQGTHPVLLSLNPSSALRKTGDDERRPVRDKDGKGASLTIEESDARAVACRWTPDNLRRSPYWCPGRVLQTLRDTEGSESFVLVHHRAKKVFFLAGRRSHASFLPLSNNVLSWALSRKHV